MVTLEVERPHVVNVVVNTGKTKFIEKEDANAFFDEFAHLANQIGRAHV